MAYTAKQTFSLLFNDNIGNGYTASSTDKPRSPGRERDVTHPTTARSADTAGSSRASSGVVPRRPSSANPTRGSRPFFGSEGGGGGGGKQKSLKASKSSKMNHSSVHYNQHQQQAYHDEDIGNSHSDRVGSVTNNINTTGGMTIEDALQSLNLAKKKIFQLEQERVQLRAESARWEKEVTKQQRRIDRLLDSTTAANKNGTMNQFPNEVKKEVERSLLARQLRHQITLLKSCIDEKDAEMDALKKAQRSTHLMELRAQNDEYLSEIGRLQNIIKVLQV